MTIDTHIELVIKIDKETYNDIQSHDWKNGVRWYSKEWKAIHNGTPLPKGHGDLVDRNDLLADSYCIDDWSGNEVNIVDKTTVEMADAVIKADEAESDPCNKPVCWEEKIANERS